MYLEVLEERAQWIFARTPTDALGWLPASHVSFAAENHP
jgi:hypothetical protein